MVAMLMVLATSPHVAPLDALTQAQREALPVYERQLATTDWLIDGSPYKARLYRTGRSNELVLANGLLARTFRLTPNGATAGLDNLVTGEAILRGVKPEAVVELNGTRYEIGGLSGQPNYAYLLPEWLDRMTADPKAFALTGIFVGQPAERLGWNRVRHHAPDVAWPPKGLYLRMDYRPPPGTETSGSVALPSGRARTRLLEAVFDGKTMLPEGWTPATSMAHARSAFDNEGKAGEIYTPANTHAYAEHTLPPGVRLVETTIDVGTDRSASWGPGIALVWKNRVVKFNVAPGGYDVERKPAFGVYDGGRESFNIAKGRVSLDAPMSLRLRIEANTVSCDARFGDGEWVCYRTVALDPAAGDPVAMRVGKIGKSGGTEDNAGELGELVRLHVLRAAAYGAVDRTALAAAEGREHDNEGAVTVSVHYELYDGIPCMSKWITVSNATSRTVTVDRFTSETLAVVEGYNWVEKCEGVPLPRPDALHVETDYAMGAFTPESANRFAVHWRADPQFGTQVNYAREQPCLLVVEPENGPAQDVAPGKMFESFRAFELAMDASDRERRGLATRRMYRTIAPWVTENPLMHHMKVARPDAVRTAIDQAAEVGFELIILSFGSGFNMDNEDPDYLATWKGVADYAASKGIEIGSYSLLSSRQAPAGNMIVPPPGQHCTHGRCPALTSEWGQAYFKRLYAFFPRTDFMLLEHDGSYPGDVDVTARPPLQKGAQDSRWVQWRIITDFYKWCRAKGISLNVPDYYYLSGSTKCGMGYREVNWSLPRAQQVIHTRQNIYDGTWRKTPSMGWMFVPLSQYHGGGAAATIEPLDAHIDHYRRMIESNLALGVQACYRGPRLYDTDRVRDMLKTEVAWFKRYRDILESDVIHGRRADGRDLDWMLHVNPTLKTKGMLVVFNPRTEPVSETLKVNLYYTGLTETAAVAFEGDEPRRYPLARDYTIALPVTVPAEGMSWFTIE